MRVFLRVLFVTGFVVACSDDSSTARNSNGDGVDNGQAGAGGFMTGSGGLPASGGATSPGTGGMPLVGTGGMVLAGSGGQTPGAGGAGFGGGGMASSTGGMPDPGAGGTNPGAGGADPAAGGAPPGTGGQPAGPDDGDPNAPIVSTPDVACGGPGGFGFGSGNFQLDGRDMIVTYPCDKHAGAPMTFFLNLHGTTPVSQHFYQHRYFALHTLTQSHNMIVVTPSSVVEQWGNGDNGQDAPHLMNIINWVYDTFDGDGKFDIRQMWVGGHSWGAIYTTTYACTAELADKIKGAVIMSGIGRNPACADRLSVISSAAEDDIGPVVNQGSVPMSHGCGAETTSMVGNNEETLWPNCNPGFVHANYFMLGKTHTSSIDAEVVERIADLMNQARP